VAITAAEWDRFYHETQRRLTALERFDVATTLLAILRSLGDFKDLLVNVKDLIVARCSAPDDEVRIVPFLNKVSTQRGPVVPTPQYQGRPFLGVPIMAFTLPDNGIVTLTPKFVSKKGNPAKVDGVPEWLVDNPALLSLTPSADGLSCEVSAVGPLGTAIVTMKADADMGAGVTPVIGTLEIEVTGGAAATVALEPGPVSEQP
jgi:hypothetical protein